MSGSLKAHEYAARHFSALRSLRQNRPHQARALTDWAASRFARDSGTCPHATYVLAHWFANDPAGFSDDPEGFSVDQDVLHGAFQECGFALTKRRDGAILVRGARWLGVPAGTPAMRAAALRRAVERDPLRREPEFHVRAVVEAMALGYRPDSAGAQLWFSFCREAHVPDIVIEGSNVRALPPPGEHFSDRALLTLGEHPLRDRLCLARDCVLGVNIPHDHRRSLAAALVSLLSVRLVT